MQEASPRGAIMRGAFRYDLFGFPPVAVREAITNAVMQRNLLPPPEVRNSLIRFALLFYKRGETEHTTLTKHTESSAHAHSIAHSTNSKPAANTSTREAIVDYLRAHDPASTKELADAAGVTAETIRRNLRQLLTENLVSTTAPQRSPKQRYQLAQQASASAFS